MQNFNLIAQSVLKLSHYEKVHNDDDNNNDNDDTHPGWIVVRDGMYSVADNNKPKASANHQTRIYTKQ